LVRLDELLGNCRYHRGFPYLAPGVTKLDPQERLTRSTGLEDYGYWFKEMAKQHKTEADSPFLRGRIWA
jgi:cyanobactin cluster PatC/TenC/TruC protein